MFALAFFLACIAVIALAALDRRGARMAMIALGATLPILGALALDPDPKDPQQAVFGDVRMRLHSVSFADAAVRRGTEDPCATPVPYVVRLGGDANCDDIRVAGLPGGVAALEPGGMLRVFPAATNGDAAPDPSQWSEAAVVSVADGSGERFMAVETIGAGDRLCVSDCSTKRAIWFRIADDGRRLVREGVAGPDLPAFPLRPRPLVGTMFGDLFGSYRPSQSIFPLRDYGRPWQENGGAFAGEPCETRFLCDRATGRPVRSFLFRDGGRQLFVALLDRGAVLAREDGTRIKSGQAPPVAVGAGSGIKSISIWQVVYADANLDPTDSRRASHLTLRRTLEPSLADGKLILSFKRKPTRTIRMVDVKEVDERLKAAQLSTPVSITLSGAPRKGGIEQGGNVLVLDMLGGSAAAAISPERGAVSSIVFDPGFFQPGAPDAALPTVSGALVTDAPKNGARSFVIGSDDSANGRSVRLSIDRFTWPHPLFTVLIGWAILFGALQLRLWRDNRAVVIVALCLQMLLLVRIFVAIGSASMDPQINYGGTLSDALLAYCAVPLALACLLPGRSPGAFDYWPCGLALLAVLVVCVRTAPPGTVLMVLAFAVVVAALARPLLPDLLAWGWRRALAVWEWIKPPFVVAWDMACGIAASLRDRIFSVAARLREMLPLLARIRLEMPASGWPWVRLALVLAGIRFVLLLFVIRERFGLALSTIYLPLSLLACAGLLVAMRRATDPREAGWLSFWFFAIVGLLFAVVPAAVADWGFMLFALPVIVASLAFLPEPLGKWRRLVAVPASLLLVSLAGMISLAVWAAPAAAPSQTTVAAAKADVPTDEEALKRLDDFSRSDQNFLRIDTVFAPESLDRAGTSEAEQMRRWKFLLSHFTSDPWGRGFPYAADVSDLLPVQADDNVSAIHLMAPFGRVGAAMFLLLLGVTAIAASRSSAAPQGVARTLGELALWTVFAAAAYMILANLVLLPFTGRNVYLLAAHSESDLVEGAVLFALAMFGLRAKAPDAGEVEA